MQNRIIIDQTRPDQTAHYAQNQERSSSLELLRIVAMLMIVSCHTNHGGFDFPAGITLNKVWQQLLSLGGQGNWIFVAISGYFLINSSGLRLWRLLNLWLRMFVYSAVLYFLFTISGIEMFSPKDAAKALMPVTKYQWWFASTYFVLYVIHPYVNRLLHSFSREEYKKFLLSAIPCWYIISLARPNLGINGIADFLCVYASAGYLRLYAPELKGKRYILYALGFIGIELMYYVTFDIIGMYVPFADKVAKYLSGVIKPFGLLIGLSLLMGFRSLNIPHSKIINLIASATFGVYLIHDNNYVRPFLWNKVFHVATFQDSPYLIPYSIAVIMAVYISCTLIELIRSRIFRALSRGNIS